MACKNSIDIAIDHGVGQSESQRGDGRSRVVAHAAQRAYLVVGRWEAAHLRYLSGGAVQIARAAIVAESLPLRQHVVLRSASQRLDIREAADEAPVVVVALSHARLLEDYLAYPYAIRVGRLPPR